MDRARRFTYIDGREVEANSAIGFFEKLRSGEKVPPPDLPCYLDLIRSRGAFGYGVDLDVGAPSLDIGARCRRALASLIRHGWVRICPRGVRTSELVARRA